MRSIGHIILLADHIGAHKLASFLQLQAPTRKIVHVSMLLQLDALPSDVLAEARLIAFKTGVVVPSRILRQLGFGAYNFHPGPPEYPGWAPFAFAIYDQAATFGATAHKMVRKVDAGPIIGIARFPLPPNIVGAELQKKTVEVMLQLFRRLAPMLANDPNPLPILPLSWGKRVRTRADFNRMCELSADLDEEERNRRRRAFLL